MLFHRYASQPNAVSAYVNELAGRLSIRNNAPHLLIEALPSLTSELVGSEQTPFVISARAIRSERLALSLVERIGRNSTYQPLDEEPFEEDDEEVPAEPPPLLTQIHLTYLIFECLELGESSLASRGRLDELLRLIRAHLSLGFDVPLRVACAGSHGSLWQHDRANVGSNIYCEEAKDYLMKNWRKRKYVEDLHAALRTFSGLEFSWLRDAYPVLGRWAASSDASCPTRYDSLARQARHDLRAKPRLAEMKGCVPLIYSRVSEGWRLYGTGARTPSRTTSRLLEQFAQVSPQRGGQESVLVKLLPEDVSDRNRFDNPIVLASQLEEAKHAGIQAVLLDSRYGVLHDDVDEREDGVPPVYAA